MVEKCALVELKIESIDMLLWIVPKSMRVVFLIVFLVFGNVLKYSFVIDIVDIIWNIPLKMGN